LLHEVWPSVEARLLTPEGLRWAAGLKLPGHGRFQVDSLLAVIAALEAQLDTIDVELRRFARGDPALPGVAVNLRDRPDTRLPLLAEIGEACRAEPLAQAEKLIHLADGLSCPFRR
jgi:hypothetical protein